MKKTVIAIIVLVVVIALGWWWYSSRQPAVQPETAASYDQVQATSSFDSGSDKTGAIAQDLDKINVGETNASEVDSALNQL